MAAGFYAELAARLLPPPPGGQLRPPLRADALQRREGDTMCIGSPTRPFRLTVCPQRRDTRPRMTLALSDWWAIAGYLLITLALGLYFRRRSGRSTEEYFVSGRTVSWWLAGTSMVATTFAADTPLAVTGLVY